VVLARQRPYGYELARADTRTAFFLLLDDPWYRELQSVVVRHAVTRRALAVALALVVLVAALAGPSAQAGVAASSQGLCASPTPLDAVHKDRRLRLVARLRQLLEADSGRSAALVARSGLDLARFGQRYSHAGVSLRDSPNTPWSVRQLYYACDEDRPRLFDQGLAGFLLAADAQPDGARLAAAAAARRGLGRAGRAAALARRRALRSAVAALQRQCPCLQHALPELQPVGGRAAGRGLGPPVTR
jgi:hypothetical protein